MKINELIAQHLLDVNEGANWTDINIKDTLEGLNYKEANAITMASSNTIAALLHHISFYNDIVKERLWGNYPPINQLNGFDMEKIKNEIDWVKLKEKSLQSARDLASEVKKFPEEKLFDLTANGHGTYYKMLHGVIEHAHYHLGQIVLLKKLVHQKKLIPERSSSL
jgi:uncharacterized damage-inducible protein DinB